MEKVYEIVIREETSDKRRTTARSMFGDETSGTAKKSSKSSQKGQIIATYHYAKRALNTVASYEVSTIELRTGSARAQQKAEFAYQCLNEASNVLESTIVGFATGGGAGAIIGTAVGLVTKAVNYAQNVQKMNLAQSVENITLAQNAIRIGAGGDRMGAVK